MSSTKTQEIVDQMVALETSADLVPLKNHLDVLSDMWGYGVLDASWVCIFRSRMCQI